MEAGGISPVARLRGVFVTGTGTGVGKSVLAASICAALAGRGGRRVSPVARSTGHGSQALIIGTVAVVLVMGGLFLAATVLSGRDSVDLRIGDQTFQGGSAERLAWLQRRTSGVWNHKRIGTTVRQGHAD